MDSSRRFDVDSESYGGEVKGILTADYAHTDILLSSYFYLLF